MNRKNLINLRDRTEEDRKRIARLGGLARQEQRRQRFQTKKSFKAFFELDDFIETYNKKSKGRNFNFNLKKVNETTNEYLDKLSEDTLKALENYSKELEEEKLKKEEKRKKQRKAINRRYYLKRKKALRKS